MMTETIPVIVITEDQDDEFLQTFGILDQVIGQPFTVVRAKNWRELLEVAKRSDVKVILLDMSYDFDEKNSWWLPRDVPGGPDQATGAALSLLLRNEGYQGWIAILTQAATFAHEQLEKCGLDGLIPVLQKQILWDEPDQYQPDMRSMFENTPYMRKIVVTDDVDDDYARTAEALRMAAGQWVGIVRAKNPDDLLRLAKDASVAVIYLDHNYEFDRLHWQIDGNLVNGAVLTSALHEGGYEGTITILSSNPQMVYTDLAKLGVANEAEVRSKSKLWLDSGSFFIEVTNYLTV
jgi:hypothetical protein